MLKVGPITAAVDRVKITPTGAGGHTSRPHLDRWTWLGRWGQLPPACSRCPASRSA